MRSPPSGTSVVYRNTIRYQTDLFGHFKGFSRIRRHAAFSKCDFFYGTMPLLIKKTTGLSRHFRRLYLCALIDLFNLQETGPGRKKMP